MKYRQIGLGTKLELELYDEKGETLQPPLISQYENYDAETGLMEIDDPFFEGRFFVVDPQTRMNVIFSKEKETYIFMAEAVERITQDQITFLKIKPVKPIRQIQRRSFFRMDCRLNIQYRVFRILLPDEQDALVKAKTRDISGGGVCILTRDCLETGVYVEAYLEMEKKIRIIGEVVRSVETKENGEVLYESGIEFKKIHNKDQELIISYIFEEQRNRLKKGWLKV